MEKITSFTIDHLKLVPGLYVSRKDCAGEQVITNGMPYRLLPSSYR